MTDARFPERWLNDRRIVRLSDPGFRLFVTALTWSVSNRTDGVLYADDLALMAGVEPTSADELVKCGLWKTSRDRWVIDDFAVTQTSRDQLGGLDIRRAKDARRAKEYRKRKRKEKSSRDSSHDDKGQARTGQDRRSTGAVTGVTCSWCDGAGCPQCDPTIDPGADDQ